MKPSENYRFEHYLQEYEDLLEKKYPSITYHGYLHSILFYIKCGFEFEEKGNFEKAEECFKDVAIICNNENDKIRNNEEFRDLLLKMVPQYLQSYKEFAKA